MTKSRFTADYRVLVRLLREVRERTGMTQVALAEKLNQTQSYVSKVERGELRLDLVQLRWWCKALDTSVTSFVREFDGRVK